jgi:UDP-N-acetylmuramoylalanine--D-glutamate ligase
MERVTILGLAREGTALARYLARHGVQVTVSDVKPAEALSERIAELAGLPIRFVLGGHPPEILDTDVVYVSPGIPPDVPILVEARQRGVRLSSSTELFFTRCRAPIVGITGSAGKTTTTSQAGEILRASGLRTWVGGNIGRPLTDQVDEIGPDDRVVLELSSFQLEMLAYSPHVAVITNLTPDHLDRHPSFEAYRAAKLGILRHQRPGDVAVLNYDDPASRELADEVLGELRWFSVEQALTALIPRPPPPMGERVPKGGVKEAAACSYLESGMLRLRDAQGTRDICPVTEIRLRGRHNLANLLAAAVATEAVGATVAAIAEVARTFAGVPHRLELVRERDGVAWYNDSIATSPARSLAAIEAFDQPIVLLAGGRHKNLPLDDWAGQVRVRVEHLILFGEAADYLAEGVRRQGIGVQGIESEVAGNGSEAGPASGPERSPNDTTLNPYPVTLSVHRVTTLEEAVALAAQVASPGRVVLLSPACTSFDAFPDYVARGERFRELVAALPEEQK